MRSRSHDFENGVRTSVDLSSEQPNRDCRRPLSPKHGLFGNDGLYSESKFSLETLFQRWASESWGEYLCLASSGAFALNKPGFVTDISYLDGRVEEV